MNRIGILAFLLLAVAAWGQSLGEIARLDREREKARAPKVVTNDNLKGEAVEDDASTSSGVTRELDSMRMILRGICSDPRTDHGSRLSEDDKQSIEEGVAPLRARVGEIGRIQKNYEDSVAALKRDLRTQIMKVANTPGPLTDRDVQKMKSIRETFEKKRAELKTNTEAELKEYEILAKQLESVGNECPEAAKTVPD